MSNQPEIALQDPRYPIGRWKRPTAINEDERSTAVRDLSELPEVLRSALDGLGENELTTPYREGGWTVRQLVHHIADSHMNAYVRVRRALTEYAPVISTYDEKAWAELHDSVAAPVEWSLELLESLHARWAMMLQSLSEEHWQRTFVHPEHGAQTIEVATTLYAWHSRHHVAHITHLRAQRGW
jgi:hypothetical protein